MIINNKSLRLGIASSVQLQPQPTQHGDCGIRIELTLKSLSLCTCSTRKLYMRGRAEAAVGEVRENGMGRKMGGGGFWGGGRGHIATDYERDRRANLSVGPPTWAASTMVMLDAGSR